MSASWWRCFVSQDFAGGLAMVDSIHVYGYQLDMRRRVKHRHHFVLVGDDRPSVLENSGKIAPPLFTTI